MKASHVPPEARVFAAERHASVAPARSSSPGSELFPGGARERSPSRHADRWHVDCSVKDVTLPVSDVVGLVVAVLGGAAVGVERQRSGHATGPDARLGGVRTFTLLGAA